MPAPVRLRMILGGLAIAALLGVAAAFMFFKAPNPSPGLWPEQQRAVFLDACNSNCRKSLGGRVDRYPLCHKACTCSADEAEKILGAEELEQLQLANSSGKLSTEQSEKLRKIAATGLACAGRAFGGN